MKRFGLSALAAALLIGAASPVLAEKDPTVVVGVKPVHSLVAAIMRGVGVPRLLLGDKTTPHDYRLKPSDARAIEQATLVVWVGPELEGALAKPIASLARPERVLTLLDDPRLEVLPAREGGVWEHEEHGGGHVGNGAGDHGADHGKNGDADHALGRAEHDHDPHIWLSPRNAKAIAAAVAEALITLDPAHGDQYRANAEDLARRLERLDADLVARLTPVRDIPFFVFHDAYQYFEHRYTLTALGAVSVGADRPPGARRLSEIRQRIVESRARCVFAEPQFRSRVVEAVLDGTGARTGLLDPLGADVPAGPDAYETIMNNLAESLLTCLAKGR